jgi:hypothetical protein
VVGGRLSWEPKVSLRDEWCDECFYGNLHDDRFPCRLCLEGGNYRYFKSKEDKKMNGYTDMKNEDVRVNCEPTVSKRVEPVNESVSYLGQSALSTLTEINEKLRSIERFVDYSDASLGDWGNPACPDNLMHNMHVLNNALNDINYRLGLLQEKL